MSGVLGLQRLAGGRRGGDHRPRRAARRARRLPAARLPRLHRRARSRSSAGPRPRAGTSPPRSPRTTCCSPTSWSRRYDPVFKVNPPLRTADDVDGAARRRSPTARSTPSPPTTPRTRSRTRTASGPPRPWACSASRPRCRVVQEAMVETGLLDWAGVADRMSVRAGADRPARRPRPAARGRRAGQPRRSSTRRRRRTVDPAALGVPQPQHARTPGRELPGAGRRHVPARPARPSSTGSWP